MTFWEEYDPILTAVYVRARTRDAVLACVPKPWKRVVERARRLQLTNPAIEMRAGKHVVKHDAYKWGVADGGCLAGETKLQRLARVIAAAHSWAEVESEFPQDTRGALAYQATTHQFSTEHFCFAPRHSRRQRDRRAVAVHHAAMLKKYARACPQCRAWFLKKSFTHGRCPACGGKEAA